MELCAVVAAQPCCFFIALWHTVSAQGDRVAVWAPNSREWIVAAIAAMTCGASVVTLNTRLKGREAGDILRRANARVLVHGG
jgi:acyl-CoA synthetase (AMP-forming)/AMP-acid ligase II